MIDNQKEPLIRKIQVRTNFSYKSVIRILSKNNLKKINDVAKQVQKIYISKYYALGGKTPFHIAVEKGQLEICHLILQNINEKNPKVPFIYHVSRF